MAFVNGSSAFFRVTRTFSKFYGLANVRIGYGLCSYPLRRTIGLDLPLFRASGISRKIAIEAIKDTEYYDKMRAETKLVRDWFIDELNKLEDVKAYKTGSNFVFIKLGNADADRVSCIYGRKRNTDPPFQRQGRSQTENNHRSEGHYGKSSSSIAPCP